MANLKNVEKARLENELKKLEKEMNDQEIVDTLEQLIFTYKPNR